MTPGTRRTTSGRRQGASSSYTPLWRDGWRERARAFLPELALTIVAAACMSAIVSYRNDSQMAVLLVSSCLVQLLLQPVLYTGTYLLSMDHSLSTSWVFIAALAFIGLPTLSGVRSLDFSVSLGMGAMVFCLTRMRPLFVTFLLEVLVLSDVVGDLDGGGVLAVHIVGFVATAALYLVRSSAAHITVDYRGEASRQAKVGDDGAKAPGAPFLRGMFGQVTALALVIGALCVAVALAGTPLLECAHRAEGSSTVAPGETAQEGTSYEGQPTDVGPSGGPASAHGGQDPDVAAPHDRALGGWLVGLALLALVVLPVPLKLLVRRLARHSIERDPSPANRAARLYLATLSRAAAAGIERAESQTPREFLDAYGMDLAEFSAPSGVDLFESPEVALEDWIVLTDVYERARYGGIDPTESELEVCWKLYDDLPTCVREALGWPRYLLGAFWRM